MSACASVEASGVLHRNLIPILRCTGMADFFSVVLAEYSFVRYAVLRLCFGVAVYWHHFQCT